MTPYAAGPTSTRPRPAAGRGRLHRTASTIEYLGLPQYPELLKTGEVVQQQLKQIGINMADQAGRRLGLVRPVSARATTRSRQRYQERTIDPDNFYSLGAQDAAAPINATAVLQPAVDKLIDQAAHETDEAKRKALYAQIRGRSSASDAPLIFAHYETINYLMQQERRPARRSTRRSSSGWRTCRCSDVLARLGRGSPGTRTPTSHLRQPV